MKPAILRAAAAAEVEEAWRWYETRRPGLGDEFLAEVHAALELVSKAPQTAPIVHRDIRRKLVKRFPYGLFYRLVDERIIVIACFHAKRNPREWRDR